MADDDCLELEDIYVHYGQIEALTGSSFAVDEGEIVTLIGANGAGKTTTLKTISGLRPLRRARSSSTARTSAAAGAQAGAAAASASRRRVAASSPA